MNLLIHWMNEITYAFIEMSKNPVIYWIILLTIIMNYKRRKLEKQQFGKQIHTFFSTWIPTCIITVISSIVVSFITIYFALNVTYEVILILSIITICVSLIYQRTFLSISYTL